MLSLRQYDGKQLVASLRQGDFAHAGEEDAISRLMEPFPKKPHQHILDAGCGLGGTAHFIQSEGWGKVTGLDVEKAAITFAQQKYPDIDFYADTVNNAASVFETKRFDIICLFNSFYGFRNQAQALRALQAVAKEEGQLAIFDYSDLSGDTANPLIRTTNTSSHPFVPIDLNTIEAMLTSTGWTLSSIVDLSNEYAAWYQDLMSKLVENKAEVQQTFGTAHFDSAHQTYARIIDAINKGLLGGVIIYAAKSAR
jgi:SAM-dependent methyltransferase